MPEYRHPLADADAPGSPPAEVHVSRRERATVADDGTFTAPEPVAEAEAERCGVDLETMRVSPSNPEGSDGNCGDLAASTSDDCGRPPGWGTESDSGPCTDHRP
jgi:hypothetical protein